MDDNVSIIIKSVYSYIRYDVTLRKISSTEKYIIESPTVLVYLFLIVLSLITCIIPNSSTNRRNPTAYEVDSDSSQMSL